MDIKPVGAFVSHLALERGGANAASPKAFASRLRELLADVDRMLDRPAEVQPQFEVRQAPGAHDVMIASEEAGPALTLIVEIRSRLVEAYHELTRMQV